MKRLILTLAVAALTPALASAQSSGSYSYGTGAEYYTTGCTYLNNGSISGGQQCSESTTSGTSFTCGSTADCTAIFGSNSGATCNAATGTCQLPASGGNCIGSATAGVKTNSGSGNVFAIRPSAIIGLLTDVTVSSKQSGSTTGSVSSSALAGVDFRVTVKPQSGQPTPSLEPSGWVTYDARFIQISTNLFQAIATQCTAIGGCFLTFAESTVSAHSFDWIAGGPTGSRVPLSSGYYDVTLDWKASLGVAGIAQALACVGPVNLTVQQNKIFSFNSVNGL